MANKMQRARDRRRAADAAEAETIARLRGSVRLKTAAAALDCDPSHLRQLLAAGEVEGHRLGKRGIRIYVDSIAAYQERNAIAPTQRPAVKVTTRPAATKAHREAMRKLRELWCLPKDV